MQSIYEFVKEQRENYRSQVIEIAEGYTYNQYETLRTIELYHNSRFTTGNLDTLKREKPFYNICKFRVNVATRATDIDTKDVKIESERPGGYAQSSSSTTERLEPISRSRAPTSRCFPTMTRSGHRRIGRGASSYTTSFMTNNYAHRT